MQTPSSAPAAPRPGQPILQVQLNHVLSREASPAPTDKHVSLLSHELLPYWSCASYATSDLRVHCHFPNQTEVLQGTGHIFIFFKSP